MSCIPSKNTRPELLLGKILRRNGVRYKKHYKIIGCPDFAIVFKKIAIFLDGDFWHGHNWKLRGFKSSKAELASYKKFWANKIVSNVKRDTKANKALVKDGWKVLRFWESDLKRNPDKIIKKILHVYETRKPVR